MAPKTKRIHLDIPEPTKDGYCRIRCPMADLMPHFTFEGMEHILYCKFAINSGGLFPRPSPGPQCIWGKKEGSKC